ncbi:hypothetical protein HBI56_128040 [Parastagonospora nodorum]|nr:hypothetical protein HBH53_177280 [Parastagonospora nodorum]KAH3996622.1 hypothetical protein HBI10_149880 [Parastagonospora nodorum]KAH4009093.1 hypothetical protein HBI13_223950 [Parastagonospora nodorum]KAH4353046.1 hypothetical protein HBH98_000320 [Parastagonospora nodorum]KAH4359543.1 hypothetical protein HBH97_210600 [Parastagonospora nodorum]
MGSKNSSVKGNKKTNTSGIFSNFEKQSEGAKRSEEKIERDEKERKDKEIAKDSTRGWR